MLKVMETGIASSGYKKRPGVVSSLAIRLPLFSQGTLYDLAVELLQGGSLRPVLSSHFLLHIGIYSFLYIILFFQVVTLL